MLPFLLFAFLPFSLFAVLPFLSLAVRLFLLFVVLLFQMRALKPFALYALQPLDGDTGGFILGLILRNHILNLFLVVFNLYLLGQGRQ